MKLWVTAGGTGSAWHICQIVKQYYAEEIELFVSDINEPELVAASTLADHFFVVPPVRADGYAEYMYKLLMDNKIDVIIPLIPWEQPMFAPDNEDFVKFGIQSLAPMQKTNDLLNNKISLAEFCNQNGLPTIRIYSKDEWRKGILEADKKYFVKIKDGFGAMGTRIALGSEIKEEDFDKAVVQEYCGDENGIKEITVEVFYHLGKVHTIARRRLEAKSGVCTKAEIMKVPEVNAVIDKMTGLLEFPKVFNVQFIYHEKQWKMMDVNLRLAAGTGLSNAAGFQMIRSLLAALLRKDVPDEWLVAEDGIKSILRVYQEVVIR